MLLVFAIASNAAGNFAATEVKINNDMPLPTPRSVKSSPIHMIKPVPAVMVITISTMASGDESVKIDSEQVEPNNAP